MAVCHFRISIVKDNENRPVSFKNIAGRTFFALGSNGKIILGKGNEIWSIFFCL
jgi:hypothetical protein